ncbi:MAG: 3-deoxy-D-manno-octulosonate 8-phosphate phosphatase KdsC [Pseudomonadota bacterium]|jgi:3-deoxy-D-manno-octulosonate 8-phosphate phosphatase (KDO 8-P phosphatase)
MPLRNADAVREVEERARTIRVLALDVDGTLTDGTIQIGPTGEAMKGFSVHDGFGLSLLREAGIRLAIVTGRGSEIVARRAEELRFDAVLQRVGDKSAALRELAQRFGCTVAEIAYMGDDWPDLPALAVAGLSAAPADARPEVLACVQWISDRPAGRGAVRELAEWLLTVRGQFRDALERHRRGATTPAKQ